MVPYVRSTLIVADGPTVMQILQANAKRESLLATDEAAVFERPVWQFAAHYSVNHSEDEWVRDWVHTNTIEGLWTTARNFLRPFRGVHKKYLHHYLAMCEHQINLKRISPTFISGLVTQHRSMT